MKLIYLSGDDEIKKNGRYMVFLNHAKKKGLLKIEIDCKMMNSLSDVFSYKSMFDEKNIYIFKNFKKHSPEDINYLNNLKSEEILIFISRGVLGKTTFSNIKVEFKEEKYILPFLIFKFLDEIKPKNIKKVLMTKEIILKTYPVEFIIGLMAKHLRDLFWVIVASDRVIYPSWRVLKLENQANLFGQKKIKSMIKRLLETDRAIKLGKSDKLLDFMLIESLQ